jgi:hypothetical protein
LCENIVRMSAVTNVTEVVKFEVMKDTCNTFTIYANIMQTILPLNSTAINLWFLLSSLHSFEEKQKVCVLQMSSGVGKYNLHP